MKFGVREICDVVFKAKQAGTLGEMSVRKGQPVLYIDSAKTSTIEGAATTVYAQGGKGNSRLISWEGEKTLTFTVEDALLSPIGFAMLSGAGLFGEKENRTFEVHTTSVLEVKTGLKIVLPQAPSTNAPIFAMKYEDDSIGDLVKLEKDNEDTTGKTYTVSNVKADIKEGDLIFVDYYTSKATAVTELNIDAENFGGYYYVEASTLFRREDGKDMPAEIVLPKVKIQSNFTFNMSSSGDPSTFTFTMDAMPDYTMFNSTKKVLCAIQVINEDVATTTQEAVTTGTVASDILDSTKDLPKAE